MDIIKTLSADKPHLLRLGGAAWEANFGER